MNKKLILILSFLLLLAASCSKTKDRSQGPLDVVYVLSDEDTWKELKPAIDTCFSEYGIMTPEFQPFFHVSWYDIYKLSVFANYRNLVVLADLNHNSYATKLARKILPEESLELAERDSIHVFAINDQFAQDQVFMMMAGSDMKKLSQSIIDSREKIFAKFSKVYKERAKELFYDNREQKGLSRVFWDKYKWIVRIPKKFIILEEAPDSNFVWLGASLPYRWFSVTWEEGLNTRLMTPNGMVEKRQMIGDYYDGIKADTTYLTHYYTKLNQWDALKMTGLWFSEKEAKGGPFLSFAFYDDHSDRTFLLDCLIFEPSPDKVTDYYREMEIMCNTFHTQYSTDIFK
ncbi:MAG: DUF4837 family protein [Candidatus Marinimicrobia bacterium]|nr:DUF4837 family protein [Candidatus Neomarinimicrobiota bacterium]